MLASLTSYSVQKWTLILRKHIIPYVPFFFNTDTVPEKRQGSSASTSFTVFACGSLGNTSLRYRYSSILFVSLG